MVSKEKPYVLFVAELIYSKIVEIKKKDSNFTNLDAIDAFMGSDTYNYISSGKFHEEWLIDLKKNNFIDKHTKKKYLKKLLNCLIYKRI